MILLETFTHLYSVPSSTVNVTIRVDLDAVWDSGVSVRENASVFESMCLGVNVVRVAR